MNLSGGQKQRLALARGLLFAKDKEVILLDEPTSSVDQENEVAIYQSIFEMYSDKLIVLVFISLICYHFLIMLYILRKGEL